MKNLIFAVLFCSIRQIFSITLLNLSKTQEDILQDLSWRVKTTVINSFLTNNETENQYRENTSIFGGKFAPNFRANDGEKVGFYAKLSEQADKTTLFRPVAANRASDDCDKSKGGAKEEVAMKTRMFSLMYETVRDTDTKVKRAELIKEYYANNTDFEIGFLMGEATDKYNSMMEVAATVKRLYNEWKPLDHINAYEQISNHAIEINTVVDMIHAKHSQLNTDQPGASRLLRYKMLN